MESKCKRCGSCCQIDTDVVTRKDVKRWKEEREDILKHVRVDSNLIPRGFKEKKCPFYEKEEKKCLIEETKPDACRRFPANRDNAMSYTKGKCKIFR